MIRLFISSFTQMTATMGLGTLAKGLSVGSMAGLFSSAAKRFLTDDQGENDSTSKGDSRRPAKNTYYHLIVALAFDQWPN